MPLWQKELLFKYFLTDMDKILGYGFHGQFNDAVVFDAILPDDLKKSILKTFYTVLHKKTCSDVALACVGLLE
jgi:hypothetical protein